MKRKLSWGINWPHYVQCEFHVAANYSLSYNIQYMQYAGLSADLIRMEAINRLDQLPDRLRTMINFPLIKNCNTCTTKLQLHVKTTTSSSCGIFPHQQNSWYLTHQKTTYTISASICHSKVSIYYKPQNHLHSFKCTFLSLLVGSLAQW